MVYTPISAFAAGALMTGAAMNLYLRDNLNALYAAGAGGVVPTLAICWWPTAAATIPANWFECNGTLGIVDLRDRFIVGAGSAYAVYDVGGALTQAQADHTAHVVTATAHPAHGIAAATAHPLAAGSPALAGATQMISSGGHSSGSTGTSVHTSQALSGAHAHTGSPFSILPLYTALTTMLKGTPTVAMPTPRTWADGDVPTAAMFNQDFRDAFNALRQRMLYAGSIILWSGSLAALPSGYQLCDGSNGTPDMRDRFDITAGSSYAVAATGGAATLNLPAHGTHSATQADPHGAHSAVSLGVHATTGYGSGPGSGLVSNDNGAHQVTPTGTHGSHSGFGASVHALHASVTLQPPYIALGYIMLTSATAFTTPRTWTDGELIDQSRLNTYMRDNESALYAGQVPIGGILAWHDSIASIPANYAHVNGSGGRYDTRDKFVMGAGITAQGATGGAASVTPAAHSDHGLNLPTFHAAHGLTQSPDHANINYTLGGAPISTNGSWSHDFALSSGGIIEHVHTSSSGGLSSDWSVDAHSPHSAMSLLPPYMALAFMQRVS